jgi:hypothetical protein
VLLEMAGSNKIRKYIAIRVDEWLKCCTHHSIKCFAFSGDDFIQKLRLFPFPQLTISFTAATTQIYTRLFEKAGTGLLVPRLEHWLYFILNPWLGEFEAVGVF